VHDTLEIGDPAETPVLEVGRRQVLLPARLLVDEIYLGF
jgi:hypothetical protein